jgi:hypothetical protein
MTFDVTAFLEESPSLISITEGMLLHGSGEFGTVQGVLTENQDIFGVQYLEFHTYNSHGNCFYV